MGGYLLSATCDIYVQDFMYRGVCIVEKEYPDTIKRPILGMRAEIGWRVLYVGTKSQLQQIQSTRKRERL